MCKEKCQRIASRKRRAEEKSISSCTGSTRRAGVPKEVGAAPRASPLQTVRIEVESIKPCFHFSTHFFTPAAATCSPHPHHSLFQTRPPTWKKHAKFLWSSTARSSARACVSERALKGYTEKEVRSCVCVYVLKVIK